MKTNRFLSRNLGAFAALMIISAPAFADSETFPFAIPLTPLTISSALSEPFTLPAFDPSTGTLTGVTLILNLTAAASPQIINFSNTTQNFTNTTTSFFTTLTGPGGASVAAQTSSAVDAGSVNGPAGTIFTATGAMGPVSASTAVSASNFSAYEGTSPLNFMIVAPGSGGFSSQGTGTPGQIGFGGSGSVEGTASIEYDFTTTTATPEPSSWMLGVVCMGLFAFLRVRVRRIVG